MTVKSFDARVKFTSSVKAIPASKPVSGNVFIFCNALNGLPLAMIFVGGFFCFQTTSDGRVSVKQWLREVLMFAKKLRSFGKSYIRGVQVN